MCLHVMLVLEYALEKQIQLRLSLGVRVEDEPPAILIAVWIPKHNADIQAHAERGSSKS